MIMYHGFVVSQADGIGIAYKPTSYKAARKEE
jgi:hypothetical protein